MKEFTFIGYKNLPLACRKWDDCPNPKGAVLIIHGMQEHSARYNDFATFLCQNGFIVYASDLRAHGKTSPNPNQLGHTDGNLFKEIVIDQLELIAHINLLHPTLPLHLFGHSFGSFITQKLLSETNEWTSAVLSGTAYPKTALVAMGNLVANATALFKGKHARAKLVERLSFGAYAKRFKHGHWLSRDEEVNKAYYADPFCGKPFPVGFYQSMFHSMLQLPKTYSRISKNKAILIIAGDNDPVGNNGMLPTQLQKAFEKNGINSTLTLFEGARHEVLNETNKQEVYQTVLSFLSQKRVLIK